MVGRPEAGEGTAQQHVAQGLLWIAQVWRDHVRKQTHQLRGDRQIGDVGGEQEDRRALGAHTGGIQVLQQAD
ncbi:hypothetical protein D3C71_2100270 [compost metagenome]